VSIFLVLIYLCFQEPHYNCFLLVCSGFRFSERGKIFAKQEVRAIQVGPGGLFFTGDGSGEVKVWQNQQLPPDECHDFSLMIKLISLVSSLIFLVPL
jgi:hypothetical protein